MLSRSVRVAMRIAPFPLTLPASARRGSPRPGKWRTLLPCLGHPSDSRRCRGGDPARPRQSRPRPGSAGGVRPAEAPRAADARGHPRPGRAARRDRGPPAPHRPARPRGGAVARSRPRRHDGHGGGHGRTHVPRARARRRAVAGRCRAPGRPRGGPRAVPGGPRGGPPGAGRRAAPRPGRGRPRRRATLRARGARLAPLPGREPRPGGWAPGSAGWSSGSRSTCWGC